MKGFTQGTIIAGTWVMIIYFALFLRKLIEIRDLLMEMLKFGLGG